MFDVTADLVSWLPGTLGVPAFARPPATRPERFATVERIGGGVELGVDRPSVALQLWAGSEAEASELASAAARAVLEEYPARRHVRSVAVDSVYAFPDPDSGHARWQVVADLVTQ